MKASIGLACVLRPCVAQNFSKLRGASLVYLSDTALTHM